MSIKTLIEWLLPFLVVLFLDRRGAFWSDKLLRTSVIIANNTKENPFFPASQMFWHLVLPTPGVQPARHSTQDDELMEAFRY